MSRGYLQNQMSYIFSNPLCKPKPLKFYRKSTYKNIKCKIHEYKKFLNILECDEIMKKTNKNFRFNKCTTNISSSHNRGQDMFFYNDAYIDKINDKIENFIYELYEKTNYMTMHVTKYESGEYFMTHVDPIESSCDGVIINKFTTIVYLNDDYKGGYTYFPNMNKYIIPEKGKLVCWNNMMNDHINENMKHCSLPVEGTKYIAVKMFN